MTTALTTEQVDYVLAALYIELNAARAVPSPMLEASVRARIDARLDQRLTAL